MKSGLGSSLHERTDRHAAVFAPFEWMLSLRYLRARRKEGFISVIAGFSFLGIMLGVATLIIVMAVMNGFRKELLDKILGLNGHMLVQPLDAPLTDFDAVARAHRRACRASRSRRRSSKARRWRRRRSTPSGVLVRGMRAADLTQARRRSPTISSRARSRASTRGRASLIGSGSPISSTLRAGDNVTLVAPRGAVTPMGTTPRIKAYKVAARVRDRHVGIRPGFVFMPLPEAQAYFNRAGDVTAIEVYTDDPDKVDQYRKLVNDAARAADLHDRLAPAQRDVLQRAAGRAQRDVPDPDADRAGGGAQHRLRPDHAGEGQGRATSRSCAPWARRRARSCACS